MTDRCITIAPDCSTLYLYGVREVRRGHRGVWYTDFGVFDGAVDAIDKTTFTIVYDERSPTDGLLEHVRAYVIPSSVNNYIGESVPRRMP